ncbi:hypothetical protein DPMN_102353 [Dreissena polymorpha]|uniref:Uncharacterized protein n=1 Tax=Dreissena polymorpha TaxID=45954 RepID=A0A9D4LKC4_DREPO|nr:hypothetical protein DPMN_102353 [Dreissena polymorpha]
MTATSGPYLPSDFSTWTLPSVRPHHMTPTSGPYPSVRPNPMTPSTHLSVRPHPITLTSGPYPPSDLTPCPRPRDPTHPSDKTP